MAVLPQDLANTLLRRKRAELDKTARLREQLLGELEPALRRIAIGTRLSRAWLIGSLAWGGFGAGSDIDIVVANLSQEEAVRAWDALSRQLCAKVDLLRLEDLPNAFRRRVQTEGRLLYRVA